MNQSLVRDLSDQDEIFSSAFSILREAIAARAFPAASVAVTQDGRLIVLKVFGRLVYKTDSLGELSSGFGAPVLADPARTGHSERNARSSFFPSSAEGADLDVTTSAPFDLASLTKAVATTTMAAILYERGLLKLDAPIADTVLEFLTDSSGASDSRRRGVTFRMLLAHSSGLPAYEKLFLRCHSREELLQAAFTTSLTADPDTRAEYSDIGFIILGVALQRIAAETLDDFCHREIFRPLGMAHTTFNPPLESRSKIPPTADERPCGADAYDAGRSTFRNRIIQGEVQDENTFVLGGVAGHAGLFSTAEDLGLFAHAMLSGGIPVLRPQTVRLFTQRRSIPENTSRALGWDTPSSPSQSGRYFGPRSFGHLGYTGTSLWIDPDRQLSVTLLTNRTWPDCSNQAIKQLRPRFHDAIMESVRDR